MQLRPLSKMGRDGKERKKWEGWKGLEDNCLKDFTSIYLYLCTSSKRCWFIINLNKYVMSLVLLS